MGISPSARGGEDRLVPRKFTVVKPEIDRDGACQPLFTDGFVRRLPWRWSENVSAIVAGSVFGGAIHLSC